MVVSVIILQWPIIFKSALLYKYKYFHVNHVNNYVAIAKIAIYYHINLLVLPWQLAGVVKYCHSNLLV